MPTPAADQGGDDARRSTRNETRYAPSSGIPELRRAILEKVRRRNGIPADDESPIVVNGGMHGLFAAFATLLDPGDEVLMFSPYWTPIVDVIAYHGARPVLVPTDEARREGLAAALARHRTPRTKLLYWNSPINPTGSVFCRAEMEEVARFRPGRGLAADLRRGVRGPDLRGRGARLPRFASRDVRADDLRLHLLEDLLDDGLARRATSSCRSAGARRCRRSCSTRSTASRLRPSGPPSRPSPWGTSSSQEARDGYRAPAGRARRGLKAAGFELEPPRAALYLFPKIPSGARDRFPRGGADLLDGARVATVPGLVFGPEGEGHLRFSFSVAEEMIAGGVEALAAFAASGIRSRRSRDRFGRAPGPRRRSRSYFGKKISRVRRAPKASESHGFEKKYP